MSAPAHIAPTPAPWPGGTYALLDCGAGEKLERWGPLVTIRPEPQAVWAPATPAEQWRQQAHARFDQQGSHSGSWQRLKPLEEPWWLRFRHAEARLDLKLKLALTAFKHVGLFPEQAANWVWAAHRLRTLAPQLPKGQPPQVLNLFAYTGGATVACAQAGAQVTHVDAIKQVVNWAAENLSQNGLQGVRWLVEDALKFAQREGRRGNTYHGIFLDPPSFGHGPKGERWKLEEQIDALTAALPPILAPGGFVVFNAYAMGFSPLVLEGLLRTHFPPERLANLELLELHLPDAHGRRLPAGITARF